MTEKSRSSLRVTALGARCLACFILALWALGLSAVANSQVSNGVVGNYQNTISQDPKVAALEKALKENGQRLAAAPPPTTAPPVDHTDILVGIALLLVIGIVVCVKMSNGHGKLGHLPTGSDDIRRSVKKQDYLAAEPSMSEVFNFFNALRIGLEKRETDFGTTEELAGEAGSRADESPAERQLREFLDHAPTRIAGLREQLSSVTAATDETRKELLWEFCILSDVLRTESDLPELRPFWLVNCGLMGLLRQLMVEAAVVNPSIHQTILGALDLMEALCVPGIDPNLASRNPVRLLAVDDDAICRTALTLALKKTFHEPDLADNGEAALSMIGEKQYDVIFLDVEMPGMNGFELCSKIRKTHLNRTTPVVFVTLHSGLDFLAKSEPIGGQDLIAKPFLSFEITVKALTLALRGRLESDTSHIPRERAEQPKPPSEPAAMEAVSAGPGMEAAH